MYQISGIAVHTVAAYKRRLRLIILTMFNKNDIRIGGEGRIVEIDESLFIKVKHNRGRDILRPKVWVFFKVDSRDAVTLLNIIYNHVLPGTTILSDCWAAYNRIIDLDRQYDHRTVNHSLTFVAPDGTHTNSIESTWRAAKRQFKEMNGVSRLYLQAYLDEYCWRLENGNRNGWMVYESIIRAIRDYFRLFPDANAVLDQTIHRENHIINRSVDDELDFGDFNNEIIEPLELGDINSLTIPSERISTTIQSASILEESVINSAATNSTFSTTSEFLPPQGENLSSTLNNNQQLIQHPSTRENLFNVTYTVQVDSPSETNGLDLNQQDLNQQAANCQVEFEIQYRSILNDFIASNEPQFACPSTLTKDQRKIFHKLASDFQLKSESKGNWKKKTLFIYKNELNNPPQTSRQAISVALQTVATSSQTINQNVLDVVSNNEAATGVVRVAKKRGRPPKISASQQPTSTEFDNDPPSQPVASSQPVPRYNLRRRQH
jgi:transposase-like protein